MTSLQSAARALGGRVIKRDTIQCPGPGHSRHDASLIVTFDPASPDGFTTHSHAGDDWQTCKDYVRQILGMASFQPCTGGNREAPTYPLPTVAPSNNPDEQAVKRIEFAANLWADAAPIGGTLAARYLVEARHITLTEEAFTGEALRFHGSCPFRLENGETIRLPTMLALMSDIQTDEAVGVHRTALDPQLRGDKGKAKVAGLGAPKKMLGRAQGSCCKLSPDYAVSNGLHIAEGLETSLTLMSIGMKPMSAMLTANNIRSMPVLGGVDALTIFADHDAPRTLPNGKVVRPGLDAARQCAERWLQADRECVIWTPSAVGADFNDALLDERAAA